MSAVRAGRYAIPEDELEIRFSRSGGPGGQNVNKRDTRVEILFDIAASRALPASVKTRALERLAHRLDRLGRVRVSSSAARTQGDNRAAACARLSAMLTDAVAPPAAPRRPTKPTRGAKERRLASKRVRSEVKRARRTPASDQD